MPPTRRSHLPSVRTAAAVGIVALLMTHPAGATRLTLSPLFGDHMVLQRDGRVPVWGSAGPGAVVRVTIAGCTKRTTAGADGRWRVDLESLPAGGPHVLQVSGPDTVSFEDVMVGDVWLASGQSNMEMPVDGWGKVLDAEAEAAAADLPGIRLFQVERRVAYAPWAELPGATWERCSPRTVRGFSGTAYFFGRALHRELGVPIGLVHASWGGTEIESWMRPDALAGLPGLAERLAQVEARGREPAADRRAAYARALAAWQAAIPAADRGTRSAPPWSAPDAADDDWPRMTLPTGWEHAGHADLDGVVWFRRAVEIPAAWAGRELTLHLGRIDDADTTFFDGVAVGHDSVYDRPRVYRIPPDLARPGSHTIAVRVYDWIGGGGLWGDAAMMQLSAGGADAIPLAGEWKYRVSLDLADLPPRPRDPDDPNQPGVLAHGMIAPLVPYALRGVIWYQGESNAGRAEQYRTLFPRMIDDWRRWWRAGDFPFLFVQLAGFMEPPAEPGDHEWADLREAQAAALARPHTGMAVAVDVGDAHDIHPRNKQEVGRRLALAALDVAYGRGAVGAGPRYRTMRAAGSELRVRFDRTGGGLRSRASDGLRGFAIAGRDRLFRWADARIEGDEVVLSSPGVRRPVAARYAWAANPPCDLVGGTGLPAAPFRTDRWPTRRPAAP
jgi:sialate O-acetylesterase